jgi:hypothetical protein
VLVSLNARRAMPGVRHLHLLVSEKPMTAIQWIEVTAKIVGIIGALVAAGLAIWQARESLKQRKRELRWKQAEMGKKAIDEIFDYEPSRNACFMIEPRKRRYTTTENLTEVITHSMVISALQSKSIANEPRITFIQDCFDSLFYYFDRIEQFLQTELVTFDDVKRPAEYLAKLMAKDKETYLAYINSIEYSDAARFLDRFKAWRDSMPKTLRDA